MQAKQFFALFLLVIISVDAMTPEAQSNAIVSKLKDSVVSADDKNFSYICSEECCLYFFVTVFPQFSDFYILNMPTIIKKMDLLNKNSGPTIHFTITQ